MERAYPSKRRNHGLNGIGGRLAGYSIRRPRVRCGAILDETATRYFAGLRLLDLLLARRHPIRQTLHWLQAVE